MFKKFLNGFSSESKSIISIDGVQYEGNNLTITRDGDIIIDGELKNKSTGPTINIQIKGDINELNVNKGHINVEGNVNRIKTVSGDVDITGDIFEGVESTSGDISVSRSIQGNVTTVSGDVEAVKIVGFTKTVSGDIIT